MIRKWFITLHNVLNGTESIIIFTLQVQKYNAAKNFSANKHNIITGKDQFNLFENHLLNLQILLIMICKKY